MIKILGNETLTFIKEHIHDDLVQLALKKKGDPNIDYSFAIQQIGARQKAKNKLPEWVQNFDLIFPSSLSVEQCSSEQSALFKTTLFSGDHLIDLSAGFGVDGLYFASQFNKVTLVEPREELCEILELNIKTLELKHIKVIQTSAIPFLESFQKNKTDKITIYIDPDRRGKQGEKLVKITDCEPNILEIKDLLFDMADQIIIKLSPMLDIKKLIQTIPEINEIIIIGVQNECKEILAIIDPKMSFDGDLLIKAVQLRQNTNITFEFLYSEEQKVVPQMAKEIQKYLYEPNPSIMKSGGFKMVSSRFNIDKIDYHSHLYTSDQYIKHFPGRCFQVIDFFGFTKNEIDHKIEKGGFYNLSTRNFPIETDQLRKQLKIKEGGEKFLFGTTMNQKHLLILCHKYN
jgi:16S rRNA G966 N2-methylase RsmD